MIRTTTRPFALVLASICLLLAASAASAGHYYEMVTEGLGQGNGGMQKVLAWVEGSKSRVEFASGEKKGIFADGNYLVTTDAGDNVYLVNPKDETYATFNLDEMMASIGQAMKMMEQMGGMVKIEITDVSSEKLLEEPGERILGHATTHYRFQSGYTMNMSMVGMKQENRSDTVMDIWATDDLDARGFGVWLRPDRQMKTGHAELDKMMAQDFAEMRGFPLKMSMQITTTDKKGRQQTGTTTMEVKVLREESIADDKFTWPDHYTETEVLPTDISQDMQKQLKDAKKKNKAQQDGDQKEEKKKRRGLGRFLP